MWLTSVSRPYGGHTDVMIQSPNQSHCLTISVDQVSYTNRDTFIRHDISRSQITSQEPRARARSLWERLNSLLHNS